MPKSKTTAKENENNNTAATPIKESLELNRLAGGCTTLAGLNYVALSRMPLSFTSSSDPLVYEPITTLLVASAGSLASSLFISRRFRSWYRQDAALQAKTLKTTLSSEDYPSEYQVCFA